MQENQGNRQVANDLLPQVSAALVYDTDRLKSLGNAISAIAQVADAMHTIKEMGDGLGCCVNLPSGLTSGYVMSGLLVGLDELGSSVSDLGDRWFKLLMGEE